MGRALIMEDISMDITDNGNAKKRKIEDNAEDSSHTPAIKKAKEDVISPNEATSDLAPNEEAITNLPSTSSKELSKKEKQREASEKYRYGNFHRYYGNRLKGLERDPRLDVFVKDWFKRSHVLDIGCNAGYLTLSIAKEFEPAWILGIDIDSHLVGVARSNIKHYCQGDELIGRFPASMVVKEDEPSKNQKFPKNVWFRSQNYVATMEEEVEQTKEEYDVILALSVTKWIHLNWGDIGMKRFFRRVFKNLRPGGRFIVESQEFATYWKRAKALDEFRDTYKKIEFKPDQFKDYLLNEVGFASYEELTVPLANSKGFDRPLEVYRKKVFKENAKKNNA